MKLENQVVSLKYAKKLDKLGFKQESLWYWTMWDTCGGTAGAIKLGEYQLRPEEELPSDEKYRDCFSAYTTAELGEMLKKYDIDYWYSYPDFRLKLSKNTTSDGRDKKEANARAEMLIYLKEKKLI